MAKNKIGKCLHCGVVRTLASRGLCDPCWRNTAVRKRYPVIRNTRSIGPKVFDATRMHYPDPPDPTSAAPGSAEKLKVMSERFLRGQGVFHRQDATEASETSKPRYRKRQGRKGKNAL